MSDVEQITKEPEEKVEKIKDPKKVAAGKRLAAANKKSKQALNEEDDNSSWLPDISFSTAVELVGIGIAVVNLYYTLKPKETKVVHEPKLEPKEEPKQQKLIGML